MQPTIRVTGAIMLVCTLPAILAAPEPALVAAVIGLGFGVYAVVQLRIPRLARPELWLVASFLVAETAIAAGVVLADRVQDGGLILLLWPMVGITARLPTHAAAFNGIWVIGLVIGAWLIGDGAAVADDPVPLIVSVGIGMTIVLLVATLRNSDTANHAAAISDQLTGVRNRVALDERIRELEVVAGPLREPVAIAVVDIDHFKRVNDEYGHAAGDDVLRGVARTLQSQLRLGDELYRLGGEEFVALLPATHGDEARHVAERLAAAVRRRPTAGHTVTVSVGVAARPADEAFSWRSAFRLADAALYEAKEAGRDRVRVAGAARPPAAV
jgi:diguanylate cyclase (GGDEF)-like protein